MLFLRTTWVVALSLLSTIAWCACPTSTLTLTTQAEVDAFKALYPNCTELNTSLFLQGSDINNLDSLHLITRYNNGFNLSNTSVNNLSGMDQVTYIREVYLFNNQQLVNLAGWDNLAQVHILWLQSNNALQSIEHLSSLTEVIRILRLTSLPNLNSLTGLENLSCVGAGATSDKIQLNDLDKIVDLSGLEGLARVAGSFDITQNTLLSNLDGLDILDVVEGKITIKGNATMQNLSGFAALDSTSELSVENNGIVQDLNGLGNISQIGRLSIMNSMSMSSLTGLGSNIELNSIYLDGIGLTNLSGLSQVTSIELLEVKNNTLLEDLSGLENITTIGTVDIANNASLKDFTGLSQLSDVDFLYIHNNDQLSSLNGLNNLTTVKEVLEITDNNQLSSLAGLSNLNSLGLGSVTNTPSMIIARNNSLVTMSGPASLATIDGTLRITNNDSLVDLSGLTNLTSVKSMFINDNDQLMSLDGIDAFINIEEYLYIGNNDTLSSILALTDLVDVPSTGIDIIGNPLLTMCHAEGICGLLSTDPLLITASNNAEGCNTTDQIAVYCCSPNIARYYVDGDGDGYGDRSDAGVMACTSDPPANSVTNNLDCDDTVDNVDSLTLSDTILLSASYLGIMSLESTSVLSAGSATSFYSTQEIQLLSDFEVVTGSTLAVYIGDCPTD